METLEMDYMYEGRKNCRFQDRLTSYEEIEQGLKKREEKLGYNYLTMRWFELQPVNEKTTSHRQRSICRRPRSRDWSLLTSSGGHCKQSLR